jgi:hypothetical protein
MGFHMDVENEDAKGRGELVRSLVVLLVLAGVGIGVLLSMEVRGRARWAGLEADNHDLQTRLAFVEAQRGEIVNFLSRPQTELVKLAGTGEWSGQALTIAWNPVQRLAVVLMDRLPVPPAGEKYELRARSSGRGEGIGEVDPEAPVRQVYSVPPGVGDRVDFEIVLEGVGGKEGRPVFVPVRT